MSIGCEAFVGSCHKILKQSRYNRHDEYESGFVERLYTIVDGEIDFYSSSIPNFDQEKFILNDQCLKSLKYSIEIALKDEDVITGFGDLLSDNDADIFDEILLMFNGDYNGDNTISTLNKMVANSGDLLKELVLSLSEGIEFIDSVNKVLNSKNKKVENAERPHDIERLIESFRELIDKNIQDVNSSVTIH